MQRKVELGQILDLANSSIALNNPGELRANAFEVYRWKTASYTTVAPLKLGLLSCGIDDDDAQSIAERIGTPLGVAFQIEDDLLDITPDDRDSATPSGKTRGNDIREGKRTVLLADTVDALAARDVDKDGDSNACAQERLVSLYGNPSRSDSEVEEIAAMIHASGALERSYQRIDGLWTQVEHAIERFGADYGVESGNLTELTQICHTFVPHAHLR
jgi:geranylgeranyl diphosphate synthase type I